MAKGHFPVSSSSQGSSSPSSSLFETTVWTEVLVAAREPDSSEGARALARLCQVYWYPVYAFIRRQGAREADAKDLTQGFFAHILTTGFLSRADPERGRFRNFLLGAVRHYLGNERERAGAQRRGGDQPRISIDEAKGEEWLKGEPSATTDSTFAFDRSWALAVLDAAMAALEMEQVAADKGRQFQVLKEFLQRAPGPGEYERVAADLGMTKGAVAAAVHRLSGRFGECVKKVVRESVLDTGMADEELQYLMLVLRR